MGIRILLLTVLALSFFAANSVLARMALGNGNIDPFSFSIIRLASGAIALLILFTAMQFRSQPQLYHNKAFLQSVTRSGTWLGGLSLFVYALCFSWAYVELETGTGALLLFGSVQITLVMSSLWRGKNLKPQEWLGLIIAFSGLVYLMLPNVQTPAWKALLAMTLSGIAWGLYTIVGTQARSALASTMGNFVRTLPLCLLLLCITWEQIQWLPKGIYLALLSGVVASGLGYAIWYSALRGLSAVQAGVVQLLVPVIAAMGGAVFVFEPIALRLVIACFWVLCGICIVLMAKNNLKKAMLKPS